MENRIVTSEEMKHLDKIAIEEKGIPAMFLMEKAGLAVATEVVKALQGKKERYVCIVCGTGNNAGDSFVAARFLFGAGIKLKIFLVGDVSKLKGDTATNYQGLKRLNCDIDEKGSVDASEIAKADVVIDSIFGIGLDREIQDPYRSAIKNINDNAKHVISVDIPSGLDGTTGEVLGACIEADVTVTFHLAKKGFYECAGPQKTGRIVVADIGIPYGL